MGIFLALIHHPVLNRLGEVGTTAVTNVDLHDLARAGRTFGVERFFIVTPIELQQELVRRVVHHWTDGPGGRRVKSRVDAFSLIEVVSDVETLRARVREIAGEDALLTVTGAGLQEGTIPFPAMRERLKTDDSPVLLLFGTGYGMAPELIAQADIRLPAIVGPGGIADYNHLSVRAAAVIVLDRLFGD